MIITKDYFQKAYNLNEEQFGKFSELFKLFIKKNNEINLSSFNTDEEIWNKHFYDSLFAAKYFGDCQNVLDLGSGGGFPLLPLAILFPNSSFISVESVGKKCEAINSFANNLSMKNVKVISDRAEKLAHQVNLREKMDLVTARAFAKFPVLLEIALPFLKINGFLIAFRGPENDENDLTLIKKLGGILIKSEEYSLPTGECRQLWIIQKTQKSSAKLPREIGVPKKRPLTIHDKI